MGWDNNRKPWSLRMFRSVLTATVDSAIVFDKLCHLHRLAATARIEWSACQINAAFYPASEMSV